jgi:DNA-binding IclR family transcriptional regulator
MAQDGAPRTVGSVETACDIIETLQELDGAGITELAAHLDLSKAAVHTQLSTLKEKEFVVQDGEEYSLSLRYLDLADYVRERLGIYDVIGEELDDLSRDTGEVAQFAVEEHGKAVYLYKSAGTNAVQTASSIGNRELLHCIALGKAILAHMPRSRVDQIIDQHGLPEQTPNTITDSEDLYEDLDEIKERGYAFDDEEKIEGIRCVAAPVKIHDGAVFGAVSVSGPSRRMEGERFQERLPEKVTRSANVIEINAKYS